MARCKTENCRGPVEHGVCIICMKFCGCSFNATSSSDYCAYHRPQFSRGMTLYSQADIDTAKEIAALEGQNESR